MSADINIPQARAKFIDKLVTLGIAPETAHIFWDYAFLAGKCEAAREHREVSKAVQDAFDEVLGRKAG